MYWLTINSWKSRKFQGKRKVLKAPLKFLEISGNFTKFPETCFYFPNYDYYENTFEITGNFHEI